MDYGDCRDMLSRVLNVDTNMYMTIINAHNSEGFLVTASGADRE